MDNNQITNQIMSAPIGEPKLEPDNFLQTAFKGAKQQYGYLKETLADRFSLAKDIMRQAPTPPKTGNFFSDATRDMISSVKNMRDAVKGKVSVNYPSWQDQIKQAKENAYTNKEKITANSTPAIFPALREKMDLMQKYEWNNYVQPTIWDKKIVDTAPKISDGGTMAEIKRRGAQYEHGGRYWPAYDVIENAVLDENSKANTSAHEFLHKFFREDKTPAAKNYEQFNKEWEEIKGNTKDLDTKRIMESIDYTLRSNALYSDLTPGSYDMANERFAYLGEEIGRTDYKGPAMNKLLKYYTAIFNTK